MRVVSINLCTDQLAMLLAAPGQLMSVSYLARDPRSSAMVEEAHRFVLNRARAEEIYLMQPDLVVAGQYASRATVDMLRRLGLRVELFAPARSLQDVRDRMAQMGQVLGRAETARGLTDAFNARLAALRAGISARPRAVLYYANGYTAGDQTLAAHILEAAGFDNIAHEAGYGAGGVLPLEMLALLAPDVLVSGQRYPGASRSEEILDHPVVQALRARRAHDAMTDKDWVCGTPHVLRAIEALAAVRDTEGEG